MDNFRRKEKIGNALFAHLSLRPAHKPRQRLTQHAKLSMMGNKMNKKKLMRRVYSQEVSNFAATAFRRKSGAVVHTSASDACLVHANTTTDLTQQSSR